MASTVHSIPAPAQQPDLRPFIVYDRLPEGYATYPVADNRHAPLLRTGEWVIIDPTDRTPVEGELFLIQWQSGGGPMIVEAAMMRGQPYWVVGARHRGYNARELVFGAVGDVVGDFPYRTEGLEERFLGRVVGILEASFDAVPLAKVN